MPVAVIVEVSMIHFLHFLVISFTATDSMKKEHLVVRMWLWIYGLRSKKYIAEIL